MSPLKGLRVLDFSTLLPGPMASLLLAEAGADVIKIERPGGGDEMRGYAGDFGGASANFALLNRGKRSLTADLKNPDHRKMIMALAASADVAIEQFRPGVMARLGLGYADMKVVNPKLIYCSITGYGQTGPQADKAAHDLNYMAEAGLLSLCQDDAGKPGLPPVLAADLAGGAYPAAMNILLALRQRDQDGQGQHLDISMCDNLFTLCHWGLGSGFAVGAWPKPGSELVTGGSARYQLYRTADGRYLAAAPLEERFWKIFCDVLELPESARNDAQAPEAAAQAIASLVIKRSAAEWEARFAGKDCCVSVVATLEEASRSPAFAARAVFARKVKSADGKSIPALPVPLDAKLRNENTEAGFPLHPETSALNWLAD